MLVLEGGGGGHFSQDQNIRWANVNPDLGGHMAALRHIELDIFVD